MKTKQVVVALNALAQESRLAVFRLLVRSGSDGLAAGAIAEALDLRAATLSFHLTQLVRGGLVDSRREGRSIIYFVNVAGVRALFEYLTEDCCDGRPELCLPDVTAKACCDTTTKAVATKAGGTKTNSTKKGKKG